MMKKMVLVIIGLFFVTGCGGGGGSSVGLVNLTAPTVKKVVPINGTTGAPNQAISVEFSTLMKPSSLVASNFVLTDKTVNQSLAFAVTVINSATETTVKLQPTVTMITNHVVEVKVLKAVVNAKGVEMADDYVSSFTVTATADTTAPTLTLTQPTITTNVPVNQVFTLTASEALDPATVNELTVTLSSGSPAVNVNVTVALSGGTTITVTPAVMATSTAHVLTLSTGIKDMSGNALPSNMVITFTTAVVVTPPAGITLWLANAYANGNNAPATWTPSNGQFTFPAPGGNSWDRSLSWLVPAVNGTTKNLSLTCASSLPGATLIIKHQQNVSPWDFYAQATVSCDGTPKVVPLTATGTNTSAVLHLEFGHNNGGTYTFTSPTY